MQITPGVHVISEMIEMMAIKSPLEVEKNFLRVLTRFPL